MPQPPDDPTSPPHGRQEIAPGVYVEDGGLRIQFSRSAGPGGQNVNKVNSKAELWVRLDRINGLNFGALDRLRRLAGTRLTRQDELHLRAETERSQEANRQEVFDRLRELIVRARVEPKHRRKTKPTRASKQRRLQSKRFRGEIKSGRQSRASDEW